MKMMNKLSSETREAYAKLTDALRKDIAVKEAELREFQGHLAKALVLLELTPESPPEAKKVNKTPTSTVAKPQKVSATDARRGPRGPKAQNKPIIAAMVSVVRKAGPDGVGGTFVYKELVRMGVEIGGADPKQKICNLIAQNPTFKKVDFGRYTLAPRVSAHTEETSRVDSREETAEAASTEDLDDDDVTDVEDDEEDDDEDDSVQAAQPPQATVSQATVAKRGRGKKADADVDPRVMDQFGSDFHSRV